MQYIKSRKNYFSTLSIIPPPSKISLLYRTSDCPFVADLTGSSNSIFILLSSIILIVHGTNLDLYLILPWALFGKWSTNILVFFMYIVLEYINYIDVEYINFWKMYKVIFL